MAALGRLSSLEEFPHDPQPVFTDDFKGQDWRRLIGIGPTDAVGLWKSWRLDGELGGGPALASLTTLAVRGERGFAALVHTSYRNDFTNDRIHVVYFDRTLRLLQAYTILDEDRRDEAIAELDRMHAELGD